MNVHSSNNFCLIITCSLSLLLSLTNCSPPEVEIPDHLNEVEKLVAIQPNSEPVYSIELIRDIVVDDTNATRTWFVSEFGEGYWFAGLEVDDSGRMYVGNGSEKMIQIFESDGSYLTNMDSEGNGYQSIVYI